MDLLKINNKYFIYSLKIMNLFDLSSVKPNFCQKPQEMFPLCKISFYQCILSKWTSTYTLVCTVHDKDTALIH
jgi:hypothetical protein